MYPKPTIDIGVDIQAARYRQVPVPLSLNDSPGIATNCQEYDVGCSTSLSTPWTEACTSLFGRLLEKE